MPLRESQRHRLARQRRVVLVGHVEKARARIVHAGLVAGPRQFDDRVVHAHACRFRGGGDAADTFEEPSTGTAAASARCAAGGTADERQLGFHFGIFRKGREAGRVDAAAAGFETIGAGREPSGNLGRVAHEKFVVVHEVVAVTGRGDREAPQHRPREGVPDGFGFRGVLREGAELVVRLHHQDPRSGLLELHDPGAGGLAAIDPDVVRAQAGRHAGRIEDLGVQHRNFDVQLAGVVVPIEREESVDLLQVLGAVRDRRRGSAGLLVAAPLCKGGGSNKRRGKRGYGEPSEHSTS